MDLIVSMGIPLYFNDTFFLLIKIEIKIMLVCGIHAWGLEWKRQEVFRTRNAKVRVVRANVHRVKPMQV